MTPHEFTGSCPPPPSEDLVYRPPVKESGKKREPDEMTSDKAGKEGVASERES